MVIVSEPNPTRCARLPATDEMDRCQAARSSAAAPWPGCLPGESTAHSGRGCTRCPCSHHGPDTPACTPQARSWYVASFCSVPFWREAKRRTTLWGWGGSPDFGTNQGLNAAETQLRNLHLNGTDVSICITLLALLESPTGKGAEQQGIASRGTKAPRFKSISLQIYPPFNVPKRLQRISDSRTGHQAAPAAANTCKLSWPWVKIPYLQ